MRLYHRSCAAVGVYQGHDQQRKMDMMKDGVVILNFARDTLVNDDDMAAALEAGKVARYVSDFPNPKVVHMKHVILTPHLGASTRESEDNCAVMAVQEITDYLEMVISRILLIIRPAIWAYARQQAVLPFFT